MHLNASAAQMRLQAPSGMTYMKNENNGGMLKNLRSSETFTSHSVSQGAGVSRPIPSTSANKETYNPTPIQRPQGLAAIISS